MPRLSIFLLGNFSVALDEASVTGFTYDKVRALLAYLAVEADRPHRREFLADLLWPGYPETSARHNLSHTLSVLRNAIGDRESEPPFLLITSRELQFNPEGDAWLDVAAFTACARTLRARAGAGPHDASGDVGLLEQAAELYRGDFLEGLLIEDSIPFEEWALLQRESLRRQALDILGQLTETALRQTDYPAALRFASRQLAMDGWREAAHRQMLCALILSGQRNAAIAHYEALRKTLASDLGVEPEAATMALASLLKSTIQGTQLSTGDAHTHRDPLAQVEQLLRSTLQTQPGEQYLRESGFLRSLASAAMSAAAGPAGPQASESFGWQLQDVAALEPGPGDPPFMGLQHFDVADSERFFGREALTMHLLRKLALAEPDRVRTRAAAASPTYEGFLAVVGASGSGKSSLVRAGVVAGVQRGEAIPGSENWTIHLMTPTAHPLETLALNLTQGRESVTAAATLMDDLARDPRSLHLYLTRGGAPDVPTLFVIDQFEELFTLCHTTEERAAFIDNLITAVQSQSKPETYVVITLRADFYDHCAEYPRLRDALSRHQVYIGAMTADGLRHAIEEPAAQDGWAFEPGLVELLLRDVGADGIQQPEPGALPLLSHALLEMWRRRRGRALTMNSYIEAGGVRGAIAKTADAVYAGLAPRQQTLAHDLFLRLTQLGEGTQDTCRRIARDEILSDAGTAKAVAEILDILADARLITLEQDTVQVAHEALIREWPTLRSWLEEDREGLRTHRHLTESALEWERLGRDAGDLYRGVRLAQAGEWASAHPEALNPLERAYLSASRAEAQRIEREREARRERELEAAEALAAAERRRAAERGRMLSWIGGIAGLLLLAAITAVVLGNRARLVARENATLAEDNAHIAATAVTVSEMEASQRRAAEAARVEADQQRASADAARQQEAEQRAAAERAQAEAQSQGRLARVNVLTLLSDRMITEQADTALLLSAQAFKMLDSPLTRSSLLTVLEANPALAGFLHTHVGASSRLAFSPDGSVLAVGGEDSVIQLWDLKTRQPAGDLLTGHHATIGALTFSPQGDTLASGSCSKFDGESNCIEGEIFVWDLETREAQIYPAEHTSHVLQLAYDPTGAYLVSRGANRVLLWDTATAQVAHIFMDVPETELLSAFTLSPDGTKLATGVCDVAGGRDYDYCVQSDVLLWDVSRREMQQRIVGPAHPIFSWAFNSDGSLLAATGCEVISLTPETNACERGYAQIWDVATGQASTPPLPVDMDWVSWSRFVNGDSALVTASIDGTIGIWDVTTGTPLAPATADLAGGISAADASPDGHLLATTSTQEPTIRLWDIAKLAQVDPLRLGKVFVQAPSYLLSMAVNPEETMIAGGGLAGEIYLWDMATGEPLGDPLVGHTDWVFSVAFSPDGATLASGSADTTIGLWDVRSGRALLPPLEGHTRTVKSVAFDPTGTLLASASDDTTMRLWDVQSGALLSVNPGMSMTPTAGLGLWDVTFSPDGTLVAGAVAIPEKVVLLWDVRDPTAPRVVARLPTDAVGGATQVAFSLDGSILAVAAGQEGTVLLWDTRSYRLMGAPIAAHQRTVWPLAFSPDGTLLASGGLDNAIRLMDVATGQLIGPPLITNSQAPFGQSVGMVHSLAFIAGGDMLLSANGGGFIHRWDVDPVSWTSQACWLAGRNLTGEEWARYLPDTPYEKTCDLWPVGE